MLTLVSQAWLLKTNQKPQSFSASPHDFPFGQVVLSFPNAPVNLVPSTFAPVKLAPQRLASLKVAVLKSAP